MQTEGPVLLPEIGINVNDKHQSFTDQILGGSKTIETRNAPTLHPYVGKKMGLVRTGKGKAMLVGYVTIGQPKLYTTKSSFDKDYDSHLVGEESPFHIDKTKKGSKWGYSLMNPESIEPRPLADGAGVAPNPRVARKLAKYVNSRLQFALSSRQIDIPPKGSTSSFGSGMVMHYVSHVPESTSPVSFHQNNNKGIGNNPRTPVQLSLEGGAAPTPAHLKAAVEGNRKVNQILGHEGNAVPFFSDEEGAQKVAGMTGGEVRSVVMSPEKMAHIMRGDDLRSATPPAGNSMVGVFSHPELGDYFRTSNHRRYIDHAQTASLQTPGAGELHEHIQREPENSLHRMVLADHLEQQGKAGLADKVRSTVPVHFRRKHAIIRFCKDRLRFSLGTSKTGRGLNSGDPVAMYSGTDKIPGSGRMSIKGPAQSALPGMVKVNHEAVGNFDFPSANLRHTDEIPGYDPGTPPPQAAPLPQQAAPPAPIASRAPAKGESLDTKTLPPPSQHDFIDPIAQKIGHEQKLASLVGKHETDRYRQHFNAWAGKTVPDADILDMMGVPRAHSKSDVTHPVYGDGLTVSSSRLKQGFSTEVVDDGRMGYNYAHENQLKIDPVTKEPYLYFGLVSHHGDESTGHKEASMAHVLYNAAVAAHRNGIKSIRLHAALGDSYVGGMAWPKLGFDANLSDVASNYRYDPVKKRQILSRIAAMKKNPITFDVAHKQPEEYSLLDLLAHPAEYKRYYSPSPTYNGPDSALRFPGGYNMEHAHFDTDPNSRSMKILTARLRKQEAMEKPK